METRRHLGHRRSDGDRTGAGAHTRSTSQVDLSTRGAAQNRNMKCSDMVQDLGFVASTVSQCHFFHGKWWNSGLVLGEELASKRHPRPHGSNIQGRCGGSRAGRWAQQFYGY